MVLNNTHGTLERISSVRQIAFRLHRRCHLKPVFFFGRTRADFYSTECYNAKIYSNNAAY